MFRLARRAMASRFEVLIPGNDPVRQRAAAEEALDEIERIEAQLSFYRESSEISRINARAAIEPVRVEPRLFNLLRAARRIHEDTGGAFDVTVAPLMKCWGFVDDTGRLPDPADFEHARSVVGMHHVHLDEKARTVAFSRPGVLIDLGAIGKGYAIGQAAILLREAGIENALIHGGTSTVYAMGRPDEEHVWKIGISRPAAAARGSSAGDLLAVVPLENECLSVSAVWGKSFSARGRVYGHVLDPRFGEPVEGAALAACVLPSPTESDALSTALLIMGPQAGEFIAKRRDQPRSIVLLRSGAGDGYAVLSNGIEARVPEETATVDASLQT